MTGALTRIRAREILEPDTVGAELLAAMVAAQGDRVEAARLLGCSRRGLYRMIGRLGLWAAIDALAAVHGWDVAPGQRRPLAETP